MSRKIPLHAQVLRVLLQEQAAVKAAKPGTAVSGLLQNRYHIQVGAGPSHVL